MKKLDRIAYKCVDCGKSSKLKLPWELRTPIEEYRCKSCAGKKRFKNIPSKKVTYKCVDCGKKRTAYPSCFKKFENKEYRCQKCAAAKRSRDPVWKQNNKLALERTLKDPICIQNKKMGAQKRSKDPKWIENHSKAMDILKQNPEWRANKKRVAQENAKNPEWLKNVQLSGLKRRGNPEFIESVKCGSIRRSLNPIYLENLTYAVRKKFEDPLHREKMAGVARKRSQDPIWMENNLIAQTGEGFWYGNKTLINRNNGGYRKYYCELWNPDLWNRIDAAYDYKSILSGKTRFDNYKQEHLSRHHLYWQEKACCEWDEDANGYYAWINNGSKRNPEWIKYYIKGDPNKFVLLTRKEHGIIRGNKKEGTDKIYYIKLMENLIEERTKEGKKCYLSKEEYEVYKVEHADIIAKYKK